LYDLAKALRGMMQTEAVADTAALCRRILPGHQCRVDAGVIAVATVTLCACIMFEHHACAMCLAELWRVGFMYDSANALRGMAKVGVFTVQAAASMDAWRLCISTSSRSSTDK
jgi:hypothetical protein